MTLTLDDLVTIRNVLAGQVEMQEIDLMDMDACKEGPSDRMLQEFADVRVALGKIEVMIEDELATVA